MTTTSRIVVNKTELAEFIRDQGPNCLIVARHGETEWNAKGKLQGQLDIPLNSRGHRQAMEVARLLRNVPLSQAHVSTLQRCLHTARPIAETNIAQPDLFSSDLLRETALGVLEGEMKDNQSTDELTRHYENFSRDEISYRIPDGETLHDVHERIKRFFMKQEALLQDRGIYLIMGHRNLNKMILKYLLGLSFEKGFRIEQEHQRIYLYFNGSKELWSGWMEGTSCILTQGFATTMDSSYA
jgi:broad specificity phosphatase PhoE